MSSPIKMQVGPFTTQVEVDFMTDYQVETPSDAKAMNGAQNSKNNWMFPYSDNQGHMCSILTQDNQFEETSSGWHIQSLEANNIDSSSKCFFVHQGKDKYVWMVAMNPSSSSDSFWWRKETEIGSGKMSPASTYKITSPANNLTDISIAGILPIQPYGSSNQSLHLLISCTAMYGKVKKAFVLDVWEDDIPEGFESGTLVWPFNSDLVNKKSEFTLREKNSCQLVLNNPVSGGSNAAGWLLCIQQADSTLTFVKCEDPGASYPDWTRETYKKNVPNSIMYGGQIFSSPTQPFNTISSPYYLPAAGQNPLLIQANVNSKKQNVLTIVDGIANKLLGSYVYGNSFTCLQVLPSVSSLFTIMAWGPNQKCDAITVPNAKSTKWTSIDTQKNAITRPGEAVSTPTTVYSYYSNKTGPVVIYLDTKAKSLHSTSLVDSQNSVNKLAPGSWLDMDLGISADNILFGQMSPISGVLTVMLSYNGYLHIYTRDLIGNWNPEDVVLPDGSFGSAPPKIMTPTFHPNYRTLISVTDSVQNPAANIACSMYCESDVPMDSFLNKSGITISCDSDLPTLVYTDDSGRITIDYNVNSLGAPRLFLTTPDNKKTTVVLYSRATSRLSGIVNSSNYPANFTAMQAQDCNQNSSNPILKPVVPPNTSADKLTSFQGYVQNLLGLLPQDPTDSRTLTEVIKSSNGPKECYYHVDDSGKHQFRALNEAEATKLHSDHKTKMAVQQQRIYNEHGISVREMWDREVTEAIKEKLRRGESNPHANDWRLRHKENLAFLEGKGQPYTSHATISLLQERTNSKFPIKNSESFGGTLVSWFGSVVNVVNDGIAVVKSVATSIYDSVAHGLQVTFELIVNGISYLISGFIDNFEAIVDIIQTAFAFILCPWYVVWNWLSHLFTWTDVRVMANLAKGAIDSFFAASDSIGGAISNLTELIPTWKTDLSDNKQQATEALNFQPSFAKLKYTTYEKTQFESKDEIHNVACTMMMGQIDNLIADGYQEMIEEGDEANAELLVKHFPRLQHLVKNPKWASKGAIRLRHHKKRSMAEQAKGASDPSSDPPFDSKAYEAILDTIIPSGTEMAEQCFEKGTPINTICQNFSDSTNTWTSYADVENYSFATNNTSTNIIDAFTSDDSKVFPLVDFMNLLNKDPANYNATNDSGSKNVITSIFSIFARLEQSNVYIPILSELYQWIFGEPLSVESAVSFVVAIPAVAAYNTGYKNGVIGEPISSIDQRSVVQYFQQMIGSNMPLSTSTQNLFADILNKFPTENTEAIKNLTAVPSIFCLVANYVNTVYNVVGTTYTLYVKKAISVGKKIFKILSTLLVGFTVALEALMVIAAYPWKTSLFGSATKTDVNYWASWSWILSVFALVFDAITYALTILLSFKIPEGTMVIVEGVLDLINNIAQFLCSILSCIIVALSIFFIKNQSSPTDLIITAGVCSGLGGLLRYIARCALSFLSLTNTENAIIEVSWMFMVWELIFGVVQNIASSILNVIVSYY